MGYYLFYCFRDCLALSKARRTPRVFILYSCRLWIWSKWFKNYLWAKLNSDKCLMIDRVWKCLSDARLHFVTLQHQSVTLALGLCLWDLVDGHSKKVIYYTLTFYRFWLKLTSIVTYLRKILDLTSRVGILNLEQRWFQNALWDKSRKNGQNRSAKKFQKKPTMPKIQRICFNQFKKWCRC